MSLVRFRPEAPCADLAHLVERHLAKVEVAGSSPVIRSKKQRHPRGVFIFWSFTGRSSAPKRNEPSSESTPKCFHGSFASRQNCGRYFVLKQNFCVITLLHHSLRVVFVFEDTLRSCSAPSGVSPEANFAPKQNCAKNARAFLWKIIRNKANFLRYPR